MPRVLSGRWWTEIEFYTNLIGIVGLIVFLIIIFIIILSLTAPPKAHIGLPSANGCNYKNMSAHQGTKTLEDPNMDGVCKNFDVIEAAKVQYHEINNTAGDMGDILANSKHITYRGYVEDMRPYNFAINLQMKALMNHSNSVNKGDVSIQISYNYSLTRKVYSSVNGEPIIINKKEQITMHCEGVDDPTDEMWCDEVQLFHFDDVDDGDYYFKLEFIDLFNYGNLMFERMEFYAETFNPKF